MTGAATAFVLASPRSGTTWLQTALNAHGGIFCTEQRLFGRHFDVVRDAGAPRPRLRVTLDQYVDSQLEPQPLASAGIERDAAHDALVGALAGVLFEHARHASGRRVVVDKITPYTGTAHRVADALRRHFPDSPIVRLLRDGRDVAVSGVFHWLGKRRDDTPGDPARDTRRHALLAGEPVDRLFTDAEIEEWATTWRDPIEAAETLREHRQVLDLRYEAMIDELPGQLARVFRFLGVDPDRSHACADAASFRRMSGGRERGEMDPTAHVRSGLVGDWRRFFTRRDGGLFHALAGECLMDLGYESDPRWHETLPERLDPRPVPVSPGS